MRDQGEILGHRQDLGDFWLVYVVYTGQSLHPSHHCFWRLSLGTTRDQLSKELIHFLVFIKTVRVFTFDVSQSIYAFIPHHYATLEFRGEDVVLRNFCALGVNFRIMRDRKLKDNTGKRKGEPGEEMN